jgi:hypothetical protein
MPPKTFIVWLLFGIGCSAQVPATPLGSVVSDANGSLSTLADACKSAEAARLPLLITRRWTVAANLSCNALLVAGGGMLQPVAGVVLTVPVPYPCSSQLFDVSVGGSGSLMFSSDPLGLGSNPFCFGAKADGNHDDTLAIQAASDAAMRWNGLIGVAITWLNLPVGQYLTTSTIFWHARGAHAGTWRGFQVRGGSKEDTVISYNGPPGAAAIEARIFFSSVSGLQITSARPGGWLSGFEYDTVSSESQISDVLIDCKGHPGDGLVIGRGGSQADMLLISSVGTIDCTSGNGIVNMNPNALSITLSSVTSAHNFIAVRTATSTNMTIIGGEYDANDINFWPNPGTFLNVIGPRSETSKRTLFSTTGRYTQNINFIGYQLSSNNPLRPPTTVTANSGAGEIRLSQPGFIGGDYIIIAGAGPGGADLHTFISNFTSPVAVTIANPVATSVSNAPVTLDGAVEQYNFREAAGGPYVHIGNYFNLTSGASFTQAIGPQIFIGNGWRENISNPYGFTAASATPGPGMATLLGNSYRANEATPARMLNSAGQNMPVTLAVNTSEQDVSQAALFQTANTRSTTISRLLGGTEGEVIYIAVHDSYTSFSSAGNIRFGGAGPIAPLVNSLCEFVNYGGYWHMGQCR